MGLYSSIFVDEFFKDIYDKTKYLSSTSKFIIEDVIFNNPATIVKWNDGTKTVVKCQSGDIYNKEMGLAMCIIKKLCGNQANYNNIFKRWIKE